jgi:hypothetical protein
MGVFVGGYSLSHVFVCVGGKVKKIFSGTGTKTRRMAPNTPINRLIFRAIAQLMYALSRVNCALTSLSRPRIGGSTAVNRYTP